MERFSGIILAGGFSSRMGRNKAELPFAGRTLAAHQRDKLRALGVTDVLIAGYAGELEGTRCVPDVYPHRGPLSGIHAGLLAARGRAALVLGVDLPLVPEETLRALLDAHVSGATVLTHGGRVEPLIGVYDVSLAAACERLLRGENTAVRRLLEAADARTLDYPGDESLLANCNTPEEYAALCARV